MISPWVTFYNVFLSASQYASRDKNCASLMVKDKNQLMLMGQSRDIGTCKSRTKSGAACNNVINK